MNLNFNFDIIVSLIGIIFYIYVNKNRFIIATKLKLVDKPNKTNITKINTPLVAIFPFFFLFILIHIYSFYFLDGNNDFFLIFFISIISFILGFIDDRKNLSYRIKFLTFGFAILICLFFSENLILSKIYFETFNKIYYLEKITSICLTLLCLLLLINAINLSDGINGLCSGIILIWLIYIQFKLGSYIDLLPLIFILIFTTYSIYRNFYFLGNSGSHFLSTFIGISVIFNYNTNINYPIPVATSVEEIFILLMIPGFDMLRLFIVRILNKKNPFTSDLDHLHHWLIKKFSLSISLFIYFISVTIPLFLYNFFNIPALLIILISVTFYIILLIFLKKSTQH